MTPAQFNLYGWQCMGWGLVAIWGTCLRTGTRVLSLEELGSLTTTTLPQTRLFSRVH